MIAVLVYAASILVFSAIASVTDVRVSSIGKVGLVQLF
jgi:hypothetical protein